MKYVDPAPSTRPGGFLTTTPGTRVQLMTKPTELIFHDLECTVQDGSCPCDRTQPVCEHE
jgi:hypothetical protein